MRILKLFMAVGVLAALTVPAGAVTIPWIPAGHLFFELTNHDNGTNYIGEPGTYTRTEPGGAWTGPGPLTVILAPGRWTDKEDTWGCFAYKIIRKGKPIIDGSGNVIGMDAAAGPPGQTIYYQWTAISDTGLVGVFYGGWDKEVVINPDGSFAVRTEGVQMDLWAVDTSLLKEYMADTPPTTDHEGPAYEVGRRDTQITYEDWVDSGDATKVHMLHAVSTYFRFEGEFVLPGGYFEGGTVIYWDIDPDYVDPFGNIPLWNPTWGLGNIFTDPDLNTGADMWIDVELVEDEKGWLAKTNDDGGASPIPEPVTMLGLLLGVGGVGGYIRRRRMA